VDGQNEYTSGMRTGDSTRGVQASSLDTPGSSAAPTVSQPTGAPPNRLAGLAKRADVILAVLLVLGSLGLFWSLYANRGAEEPFIGAASRFDSTQLPLQGIASEEGVSFGNQRVAINGTLQANGDIIVAPSPQPTDPIAGQIYYDQTSNVLAYYNGASFVQVGGGVTSLQGQDGDVTLSGAGGITVTEDGAGNITLTGAGAVTGGVTSLNGLTGGVTVANSSAAGATITINDATTASKGIASFNATNFSINGGAVNTVQNINIGATPTFAGVNTNTIQGGASLSLLSGGNVSVGVPNAVGTLLVLDTKSGVTDPTGVEGGMYYNSALGKFRCFQAGVWIDCIDASGGFVSLQNAYNNSTPAIINLNATNDGILVRDTAGGIGGNLFAVQNSDGSATYLGVTTAGVTSSGNATLQGGTVTLGTTSQQGSLVLHDGNGQTTTLQAGDSGGNLAFVLPTNAGGQFQCLKKGTVGNQLIWDACDGGGGGTSTDLQGAYENGNTISATNADGDIAFTLTEATNFLANIIGSGRFAVQSGGTDIMGVAPGAVTLGTNVDLLLQGDSAYISNPGGQTGSEVFGLNASVDGANSVAVGNGASGGTQGVAVGQGADSGGNGVAIGQGASTGSGIAIGQDASTTGNSIALGRGADTLAANQLVIGDSTHGAFHIDDVYIGNGVTNAAPIGFTLNATGGNGTDIAGADISIAGGRGTGTGNGGDINLQVALPTTTGNSLNSLTTALNVSGSTGVVSLGTSGAGGLNGQLAFRNTTNSNVITLQGEVATANQNITLPNATGTVCLTSGNCAGVGGTGDILQNGNAFGTTMTLGTNDNFDFGLETRGTTWVTIEGTALQADSASRVVLAGNVDLIMQGATAFISNPMGQTNAQGFGQVTTLSNEAVAFGDNTIACPQSVAIGFNADTRGGGANCNSDSYGVGIGWGVNTNGGSVAIGSLETGSGRVTGAGPGGVTIGNGAQGSGDSIAIGRNADTEGDAVAIGAGAMAATGGVAIGDSSTLDSTSINGIAIGFGSNIGTNATNSIVLGRGATASGISQSNHLVIGSNAMSIQQGFIGNGITNATPSAFTLNATGGSGTDIAGANLNLAGGKGTGSANGGNINFQVTFGGQTSGTDLRTLQTVGTFSGVNGSFTLQNAVDSTTAFRVLDAAGTTSVLTVDTSTPEVIINGTGAEGTGGILSFGTGAHAPSISRIPGADVPWLGEETLRLTAAGLEMFSTASDPLTDPPTFTIDSFNGRFNLNMASGFGYFSFNDTSGSSLFNINGNEGNGEAVFQNHTDSLSGFRILNAGGSMLFNVDTTNGRVEVADVFEAQSTVQLSGITETATGNALCFNTVDSTVFYSPGGDCTPSSARYKENIQTMENEMGLEVINALRPVTYTYKDGDGSTKVGLIAEDVHEVLPEAVVYDEQGRPDSVAYGMLTANLIKAIQQQQVQINELRQGVLSGALVEITGHIRVGKDTAGTVTIPAGQTSVNVTFNQPYETAPIVTVGAHDFVMVRVLNATTTGFTLAIPEPTTHDIRINWTALEPKPN
jgi:hypothetical protein